MKEGRRVRAGFAVVMAILVATLLSCGSEDSTSTSSEDRSLLEAANFDRLQSGKFYLSFSPDDETAEKEETVEVSGVFAGLGARPVFGIRTRVPVTVNGWSVSKTSSFFLLGDRALLRDGARIYDLDSKALKALWAERGSERRAMLCRQTLGLLQPDALIESLEDMRSFGRGSLRTVRVVGQLDASAVAHALIEVGENGLCGARLPFSLPLRQLKEMEADPDALVKHGRAYLTFDSRGILREGTARIWVRRGRPHGHEYSYQAYFTLERVNEVKRVHPPDSASLSKLRRGRSRDSESDLRGVAAGLSGLGEALSDP